MIATESSHDLYASCNQAGDFQCPLDGFCATIAEKEVMYVLRRDLCQTLQKFSTHCVIKKLRTIYELAGLCRQCFRHFRASMPDIGDPQGRGAIDIFVTFFIPQNSTPPSHNIDRSLGVYSAGICVFDTYRRCHREMSLTSLFTTIAVSSARYPFWMVKGSATIVVPSFSSAPRAELFPICTRATPPASASCAASNFFRIPPCVEWICSAICAAVSICTKLVGSSASCSRPRTFVIITRASAPRATAMAAAARSPSTLSRSPSMLN